MRFFLGTNPGEWVSTFFGNGTWPPTNANTSISWLNNWRTVSASITSGTNTTRVDGSVVATTTNLWNGFNNRVEIGGSFNTGTSLSQLWQGDLCEVVITTTTLSTADSERLEGYLAHKWGLTANLPAGHPYKTTPP